MESKILTDNERELILKYFSAFANLYAIISVKRAFRIITQQNPELNISEEAYRNFLEDFDGEGYFYTIMYEEEIYKKEELPNDVFKKFIIAEYIYIDEFEIYEELKAQQEGRRFYIPDKEELLRYEDDFYLEKTDAYYAMEDFLATELKLKSTDEGMTMAENMSYIWQLDILEDDDIEFDLDMLIHIAGISENKQIFKNDKQFDDFLKLYNKLRENTRRFAYRGHTPAEIGKRLN